MANIKLSAIASGGAIVSSTDTIVGVRNGTTDVLITPGSLAALDAAPAGTLTGSILNSTITASSLTSVGALASGSLASGFTLVPNSLLAHSAITIGAQTGLAGGGSVVLGSAITLGMATSVANTLAGYNSSGVFSDVSLGSNLTLISGVLASTSSGAVASVFGRTGSVTASWSDYQFNLIGGTAAVSQGGTGQTSLIAHSVLLGEGAVTGVGFATGGTPGRLLIDQGNVDPAFQILSGDSSISSNGVMVNLAIHGVTYPSSPSTNTVPVVTSSNTITYEAVPNAALANSSVTVSGVSGVTGGGIVALGSSITLGMAGNIANTLAGYNSSGVFSDISIGSNLTLVSGVLASSGGGGGSGTVTSVTFTGDGTVLSSTPSSAVIASGTVTATLANAPASTVLSNNTSSVTSPSYSSILVVGIGGYTPSAGGISYQGTGSANNSFSVSVQNLNSGSSASTDLVATADNGTDTTHYFDAGINGSAGGAAPFTTANEAYMYTTDNILNIAAIGSSGIINFYTTGGATPVLSGKFDASQNFYISKLTSNGLVKTSGGNGLTSIASAGTDYQAPISLTTTGTSGAATFISNVLNIPQYTGGGGGGTSLGLVSAIAAGNLVC